MNRRDYDKAMRLVRSSPEAYRKAYLVDTDDGPKRYADVLDPWQREDLAVIDPGHSCVMGQGPEPPYQRIWLERPRGHSKTTDLAVAGSSLLFSSERRIDGVVVSGDRDQAGLVRDAMDRGLRNNPWQAEVLEVQQWKVVNKRTGSTLQIMAADVASSYGLLIDFAICDEITHWPNRALFDSILSAIAKRRNGLLWVIANAGFRDHWTWDLRELVRVDPAWYFRRLDGPVASWISPKHLAEQRRLLMPQEYSRLWLNQWANSDGTTIDPRYINACTVLKGPMGPRDDRMFVAGLDLGLKHDHSAFVILAVNPAEGVVELARSVSWKPEDHNGEVDVAEIEHYVLAAHEMYNFAAVAYDPWQAAYLAQRLSAEGLPMCECQFTPANKDLMARSLLGAFQNNLIRLYPDPDMAADLGRLRIKEGPLGFRLDSVRDARGHADRAIALSTILPAALYEARNYCPESRDELLVT